MNVSKKTGAFIVLAIAIGIGFGINFQSIKVPTEFEQPSIFRCLHTTFNVIGKISKVLEFLDIESQYESHRRMVDYIFSHNKRDNSKRIKNDKWKEVGVRIYTPKGLKETYRLPTMVYIHGNFRAFGSLKSYDLYLITLAKKINMKIISIDYKLPPEAPFVTQLNDCFKVMQYILKHAKHLDIDLDRLVLAGDSEGGHLALSLSQKLYSTDRFVPKLQVLIYPNVQMFNLLLPSSLKYQTGLLAASNIYAGEIALWNVGIKNATAEMALAITGNNHISFLKDMGLLDRFQNYLNLVRLSPKYKSDQHAFYQMYQPIIPDGSNKILEKDSRITRRAKQFFNRQMSPGLVDTQDLMSAPHTYFLACEMDGLRDEQMLYAERLKSVKTKVEIAYYKSAFHGIAPLVDSKWGFEVSRKMLDDLANYINQNV